MTMSTRQTLKTMPNSLSPCHTVWKPVTTPLCTLPLVWLWQQSIKELTSNATTQAIYFANTQLRMSVAVRLVRMQSPPLNECHSPSVLIPQCHCMICWIFWYVLPDLKQRWYILFGQWMTTPCKCMKKTNKNWNCLSKPDPQIPTWNTPIMKQDMNPSSKFKGPNANKQSHCWDDASEDTSPLLTKCGRKPNTNDSHLDSWSAFLFLFLFSHNSNPTTTVTKYLRKRF